MRDEGSVGETLNGDVAEFLRSVTGAMGLTLESRVETTADGPRANLEGQGADYLLRRNGELLQALQHIASMAFRDRLEARQRVLVDCLGFRRDKDEELKQMARFLADKARRTGLEQKLGPLNPYDRRIVHMAVAEDPGVSSESIGDAFMKTVMIAVRK
jgi:spoIIIJ-associated protein